MNPRTLTITAAEWASVRDGSLWLVQEADVGQGGLLYPPVEFVEACAPCETCGNARRRTVRDLSGVETFGVPCPDCRIELVGPCPTCNGGGMIAHCGRTDNGSDGPCVLAPHADNFPCYGEGDVASDWSPVSWCDCGICSCGSHQAWTDQGPCGFCHERPRPGTVTLGFAYAVGEPLPIWGFAPLHGPEPHLCVESVPASAVLAYPGSIEPLSGDDITDRITHYGDPSTLVGKYAMQLRRVS